MTTRANKYDSAWPIVSQAKSNCKLLGVRRVRAVSAACTQKCPHVLLPLYCLTRHLSGLLCFFRLKMGNPSDGDVAFICGNSPTSQAKQLNIVT